MWQNFFDRSQTKGLVLSSIFTKKYRKAVKMFSQLKNTIVSVIVFFSIVGLNGQICYPFIKRQYFTLTEKVVGARQFSSWNTMAVSNRSKGFWVAGYGTVNGANHGDGWLMKYDDTGKFVGAIRYGVRGTGSNEIINDVATTPSGGCCSRFKCCRFSKCRACHGELFYTRWAIEMDERDPEFEQKRSGRCI